MNLAALIAQRDNLDAQIAQIQQEYKARHVAEVKSLMAATGLTLADLGAVAPVRRAARAANAVPPKYRDASGNTWSGRGFKPRWLQQALAAGASLDSFRIAG